MLNSHKRLILAVISVVSLGGTFAAQHFSSRARSRRASAAIEDVLPDFKELPPGPRAPKSSGFGVAVGKTRLEDVEEAIARRSLSCNDTSARALMKAAREHRAVKKAADDVDATSSASSKKTSPMEKNPQVRLSCEGTAASAIGDRARPEAIGRLLYIFDSNKHPLRHVSYRRVHKDAAAARNDALDALAAMTTAYGPPSTVSGALPAEGAPFERYAPYKAEWVWTDVKATVSALSFGERGVDVYEAIEVPWPIRSDVF